VRDVVDDAEGEMVARPRRAELVERRAHRGGVNSFDASP
jgi:hypothetical protein